MTLGGIIDQGLALTSEGGIPATLTQADESTGAVCIIDFAHKELHEGCLYVFKDYYALGNRAVQDILIKTPDTSKWARMVIEVAPQDGAGEIILYEAPTVSANGTLANTRNRNRNMAEGNTTLVYINPTTTAVGNLLTREHLGSGKSYGGVARDSVEKILKQNTLYLLRITNNTTSTNNVNVKLNWYEHSNI